MNASGGPDRASMGRQQNSTCLSALLWITSPLTIQIVLLIALFVVAPQSSLTSSAPISTMILLLLSVWLITALREIFSGHPHSKHSHETAASLMET